ncbi:MAG TPA: winged helix-turn-helix domain-containing protein [Bryobacteraceae bacterium]|nr:winged helix-turn-helix domain-containing protein [Bryobacteraceae bacterium]
MNSEIVQVSRSHKYRFADFELAPGQGALWRDGDRVPVMPKPLAVLTVLVESAGQIVSKEELLEQVWNGAAIEDNNVTQTISTLRKILGEKRGENRFIVTEPGNGYRFVAPVTRIDTAPLALVEPLIAPVPSLSKPRRKVLYAFAALALLCVAAGAALWFHRSSAGGFRRKSVAVLGIRDLSKSSSETWLQTALAEMLTSELASAGKLRTIPSDDVVRWRSGLGNRAGGAGDTGLLKLAHRNFDADAFVLGSYVTIGTCPECRVRVDLGVFDARTGERLSAILDEAPARELLDLTTRLGAKLRAHFGIDGPRAAPPPWPVSSAMREYAEGLSAFRRIDPMAARDHLQAAANADPGNALIHSALADVWTMLGYSSRATDESRRAYELSSSLSRLDQLAIEARYRANAQQRDRAIEIYRSIFRLFPDSLEDGLNLARAQFRGMKYADAISTLTVLRRLPKPAGNDPRIDLLEAQCFGAASDFVKTRDGARRSALEAKSRGAMYLYARARLLEGGAMQTMAEPRYDEAQTEARTVCEQLGDRQCVATAWRIRGNERFYMGKFREAQEAYLQGAVVARELGDNTELSEILNGLGVVAEANLEWDQAEKSFLEAISLRKEAGYSPSDIQVQLADFYLHTGRLREAARAGEEAYVEAEKTSARLEIGEVYLLRSELARLDGSLPMAQDMASRSIVESRATKSSSDLTLGLASLSSIQTARGDLQQADVSLAEASKSYAPLHQSVAVPEVQGAIELARAELLLAKGDFQHAADEARRSAADFSAAHLHQNSGQALVVEANALDILGRIPEALQASQLAQREAAQTPDPTTAASVRLIAWRLGSDSQEPPDLRASIAALKNPELTLEEDLARALRAKRSGASNAQPLFQAVARRAAGAGYLTLSRRALALAQ